MPARLAQQEDENLFPLGKGDGAIAPGGYPIGKPDIPRTYVIDANGKIVFQSSGFNPKEFNRMVEVIGEQLKRQ